ncbi:MAG: hypothetical protein IJU95_08875 [Treponema sp.]|nr:hypothetical protein [Treponema sp.]
MTRENPFPDGESQMLFHKRNCAKCCKRTFNPASVDDVSCATERAYLLSAIGGETTVRTANMLASGTCRYSKGLLATKHKTEIDNPKK